MSPQDTREFDKKADHGGSDRNSELQTDLLVTPNIHH